MSPQRPTLSTDHQRTLLADLAQLVEQRARSERKLESDYAQRKSAAVEAHATAHARLASKYNKDQSEAQSAYDELRQEANAEYQRDHSACEAEYAEVRRQFEQRAAGDIAEFEQDLVLIQRSANDAFDADKAGPLGEFTRTKEDLERRWHELQLMEGQAWWVLGRRRCRPDDVAANAQDESETADADVSTDADTESEVNDSNKGSEESSTRDSEDNSLTELADASIESAAAGSTQTPEAALEQYAVSARDAATRLRRLYGVLASKFVEGGRPLGWLVLFWLAAAYPAIRLLSFESWHWIAASGTFAVVVTAALFIWLRPITRQRTLAHFSEFQKSKSAAEKALTAALEASRSRAQHAYQSLLTRRDELIKTGESTFNAASGKVSAEKDAQLDQADQQFTPRLRAITQQRDQALAAAEAKYPPLLARLAEEFDAQTRELESERDSQLEEIQARYDQHWAELIAKWESGMTAFESGLDAMQTFCSQRFAAWGSIDWNAWQPPSEALPAIRFGEYQVDLANLKGGAPKDPRLIAERTEFAMPALLSFPDCPSLLLEASSEGRDRATEAIQNVMLRLLTSLPPGKVRYTIIDPTGLGQNFSAFMHLADYDERLVSMRIWTETSHINQRLTDLTEHMEKVIQKYLRNEYESIQEYNDHAGEVAEPFQILVIANFPANFSEEATRRLVSIATSGARCGVYTLISHDTKLSLPRNFDLADLEKHAATLVWRERRFNWKDAELKKWPLTLDPPPRDEAFTAAVRTVGQHAQDSNRVEVPFNLVVPDKDQWWQGDSRSEVEVALGRTGATKFQTMKLGRGTSQHVLMAGKTGSGKSTLLHVLITNLAIHYGPDEVQFYLIDFKKGVEFKAYARFSLPHARVIAIESEREFGLSVLERLDLELKRRGDLFREQGVQDLQGFRNANPGEAMPRILLIIDEFQELFVKDDKLAQDASLLLDRLVRQGRAFGIHVLLGSQTLAGAYSLARSTIGQMAVRIALQCSDGDAHLILSEDNTAARLLSRPGEAIYNDANGLFEGNHPFQVVWLPDEELESNLSQLTELAGQRALRTPPPIVFEGNIPADPAANPLLEKVLRGGQPAGADVAPRAWLGAAVAIKDPTMVVFRRQSGSHLLLVGQQEELAAGVLSCCLVSLAAQQPPESESDAACSRFYVFDGVRPDAPDANFWPHLLERLPIDAKLVPPRRAASAVTEVAAEVARRVEADEETSPPIFLLIYNIARFRDLKKSDDAFSFDLDDNKPASAGKQLADILRDGPSHGVHVLIWCDSYNNASRWFDRQTLNDMELRVLFQMSPTDSANLIESPAAGHLGVHRAVLYHEDQNEVEKFRPYGPPSAEWLALVKEQLEARRAGSPTA